MRGKVQRMSREAPPLAAPLLASGLAVFLAVAGCASAPKRPPEPSDVVVLLPDEQGKTGAVIVSGTGGRQVLSKPWEAVNVPAGGPPGEPYILSDNAARAAVAPAIAALPPAPLRFTLYFQNNTSELMPESRARIRDMARTIRERAPVEIGVDGYTDTVGSREHNDALSLKRARKVASLLAAEGLDTSLFIVVPHGKEGLLVPTGEGIPEPRNRRVEVTAR